MKYNEAIKKLMLTMCLTQTKFGAKFGVSFGTVNRWEAGTHEPTMKIKRQLKKHFEKEKIIVKVGD